MSFTQAVNRALKPTPLHRAARDVYRAWRRPEEYRAYRARLALYRQFVPRGGLAFDVGANFGSRSEVFLDLGARVVAIEPQARVAAAVRERFRAMRRFALVEGALGAAEAEMTLYVSSMHLLTTLSADWVDSCRRQAHLKDATWTESTTRVTTLDALIGTHGVPDFVKIDVEGFEVEVLRGLSRPVGAISFEFTPWRAGPSLECVRMLIKLGMREFNVASGEEMTLRHNRWLMTDQVEEFCRDRLADEPTYGDIYARFPRASVR